MLRKLLGIAGISSLLIAPLSAAKAADMPVKAPPLPPLPAWSWTGFYVGGYAGGAWGTDGATGTFNFPIPPFFAIDEAAENAATSPRYKANGFTGGVEAGGNYQVGHTVFGFEADFGAFNLRGSTSGTIAFPSTLPGGPAFPPTTFFTPTTSVATDWLFTARPRLGWATDHWLFYVTGGLAVTRETFNQTIIQLPPFIETASTAATRAGSAVGGGIEYAFARNWSAKVEYLYVDFGHIGGVGTLTPAFAGFNFTDSSHLTASIARVGLNYKFDWAGAAAPMVTK